MTRPSIPRAHNFPPVVYGYRTNACQPIYIYIYIYRYTRLVVLCIYRHGMHVSRSFTRRGAWDRNNYVTIINGDHKADAVPRHICQNEENVDIGERVPALPTETPTLSLGKTKGVEKAPASIDRERKRISRTGLDYDLLIICYSILSMFNI